MRVLLLSSFFPPDAQGGAEMSAWNFANWLRDHGHDVGILTTARKPDQAVAGRMEDGLHVWRISMPRPYPVHDYGAQSTLAKTAWHIQDHIDPRNRPLVAEVLETFRPDFVVIYLLTGIGWNILPDLERHGLPVLFALPDLVLACLRSGMFRDGRDCERQCRDCRLSSFWKQRMMAPLSRIGFYSPSAANLRRLESFVPLGSRPRRVIFNPNRYPRPTIDHIPSDLVRFLYAGRLHPTKGVDMLLAAAEKLALDGRRFHLGVAGDGPDGPALRTRYAARPWLSFHGHVPQPVLADLMAASDMLCLPSIWSENAPGVAIQAIAQGLPVLGSDRGGIPEIVDDGITGLIVAGGDIDAWAAAMGEIIDNPARLARLRATTNASTRFDPEQSGHQLFALMTAIGAGDQDIGESVNSSGW